MKDFDIAKYLRENSLGSHAILGAYVDLHALKEAEDLEGLEIVKGFGALKDKSVADKYAEVCKQAGMEGVKVVEKDGVFKIYAKAGEKLNKEADYGNNEPVDEVPYVGAEEKLDGFGDEFDQVAPVEEAEMGENAWMEDVDGTDAYKVGNWTCYYDHPGILVWSYGDTPLSELAVYATPNFDGDDTTPIQIAMNGENRDMMAIDKGIFADFNEYARAMKPYFDTVERMLSDQGSEAPVEEMDNSMTGDKGWQYDDEDFFPERDKLDRMLGLSHEYIGKVSPIVRKTIESLRADGFDDQDIIDFLASDLS